MALFGLTIPSTAGLLVLLAPGLVPSAGRHVDGRDIRAVLLLYVGVVGALYLAIWHSRCSQSTGRWGCFSATRQAPSKVTVGRLEVGELLIGGRPVNAQDIEPTNGTS
jgi:hypothetical protein